LNAKSVIETVARRPATCVGDAGEPEPLRGAAGVVASLAREGAGDAVVPAAELLSPQAATPKTTTARTAVPSRWGMTLLPGGWPPHARPVLGFGAATRIADVSGGRSIRKRE
jgi:hypothetical protein